MRFQEGLQLWRSQHDAARLVAQDLGYKRGKVLSNMAAETLRDVLAGVAADESKRRLLVERHSLAHKRHLIYFTPRSGSSWLTSALEATHALGRAGEYFNPNFVGSVGASLNANTLEEYVDAIVRTQKSPNDVFTAELTFFHYVRFDDRALFFEWFEPEAASVLLVRENIVLQAISLYKAVETQVFHTASARAEAVMQSQKFAHYDGDKIFGWVRHILQQERGLRLLFEREGIDPLRLSYERMFAEYSDPIRLIAEHFGVPVPRNASSGASDSGHQKLASEVNLEMERRLRSEFSSEMREVDSERESLLASLHAEACC